MNIGEKIYKLRTEKNLSQGDLADMLDVSRQSVSKWENDTAVPDLDKLIKLCDTFEISIDELVGREKKIEKPQSKLDKFKNSLTKTQRTGCILIGIALLCLIIPMGQFLTFPLVSCGVICVLIKKYPWYWCVWALFLSVYIILYVFMNGNFIIPHIIKAVFFIIMAVIAYVCVKDIDFNINKDKQRILVILSAVYIIAYIVLEIILIIENSRTIGGGSLINITMFYPINCGLMILFSVSMFYLICFVREARQKK